MDVEAMVHTFPIVLLLQLPPEIVHCHAKSWHQLQAFRASFTECFDAKCIIVCGSNSGFLRNSVCYYHSTFIIGHYHQLHIRLLGQHFCGWSEVWCFHWWKDCDFSSVWNLESTFSYGYNVSQKLLTFSLVVLQTFFCSLLTSIFLTLCKLMWNSLDGNFSHL